MPVGAARLLGEMACCTGAPELDEEYCCFMLPRRLPPPPPPPPPPAPPPCRGGGPDAMLIFCSSESSEGVGPQLGLGCDDPVPACAGDHDCAAASMVLERMAASAPMP